MRKTDLKNLLQTSYREKKDNNILAIQETTLYLLNIEKLVQKRFSKLYLTLNRQQLSLA